MRKTFLTLLLCCGAAHAEFNDGNKLLSAMKGDVVDRMYALGYVVGIADMGRGYINCMPANATAGQISDMVRNYLENTPADRHLTGDVIVNKVLAIVWPCPKKGNSL